MSKHFQHMKDFNHQKPWVPLIMTNKKNWLDYTRCALKPLMNNVIDERLAMAHTMMQDIQQLLNSNKIQAEVLLIGGWAANTQIKDNESIDILILFSGHEHTATHSPQPEDLILMVDYTRKYLKHKFPEAHLNDSHTLALEMSFQSLPCRFCYYYGHKHMNKHHAFGNFSTQNLQLLNQKQATFEQANPLLLLDNLANTDENTHGNTKALIRILKTLKNDSVIPISLTGHQITSIIYSMEEYSLTKPQGHILLLLLEVSLFLNQLIEDPFARRSLKSPDKTILMKTEQEESFIADTSQLKKELDALIKHLVLEIDIYTNIYDKVSINH